MLELLEILKRLMLFEICLEQNKVILIENKLKINNYLYSIIIFQSLFFYSLPCVHRIPVKPLVQLHINDEYDPPKANRLAGLHVPYIHGFCAQ